MTKTSIIIPHYNNYQILNDCLQSLYKSQLNNTQIIIVNNNSTDDSIEKITNQFLDLKVVSTKTNKGYAGGCNFGAKYADGDYIVFLNNDTVVDQKWLIELIKLMDEKPTIASNPPGIDILKPIAMDGAPIARACASGKELWVPNSPKFSKCVIDINSL